MASNTPAKTAATRPSLLRSSSSKFAMAFEQARNRLDEQTFKEEEREQRLGQAGGAGKSITPDSAEVSAPSSPGSLMSGTTDSNASPLTEPSMTPLDPNVADNFAFAFDIDGVLIRGGKPIPEAIQAMKVLNGENEYGIQVPYIFLTNGGGKFEEERCRDLSGQLGIDVSPGQFICGHTPMREYANKYGTVLVVGGEGEKCRQVAESYGFRDVITPGDILKANAATAPFRKLTPDEYQNSRDLRARVGDAGLSSIVIEAIFVFADSRDWAGDLQIILDIAQSKGGRLETRSETFEESPPVFFSHNDVLWSAAHEHARLGMGALRKICETIFTSVTGGKKLPTHAFGKPQVSTMEFADRLLRQWRAQQHGHKWGNSEPALDTVYFVGDTPESDVRGTNAMDRKAENEWYSILVKTGVYQDGTVPAHPPRHTCDTVLDAVNHGIRREMERRQKRAASEALAKPINMAPKTLAPMSQESVEQLLRCPRTQQFLADGTVLVP